MLLLPSAPTSKVDIIKATGDMSDFNIYGMN